MKINAYVLAADPAWLPASVGSYYDIVDRIIVTYDQDGISWKGTKIDASEAIESLKKCDPDNKMEFRGGHFGRKGYSAMANDTFQRQVSISWAAEDADWVMQLDGDEILPNREVLLQTLEQLPQSVQAVEWPMRVMYGPSEYSKTEFLEICSYNKAPHYEYPGPIVVRPGAKLVDARRIEGLCERVVVEGDVNSLQVKHAMSPSEQRTVTIHEDSAVIHFSWVRTKEQMRSKLGSWGHISNILKSRLLFWRWLYAPKLWPLYRNFHPFANDCWPRLRPVTIDWQQYVTDSIKNEKRNL